MAFKKQEIIDSPLGKPFLEMRNEGIQSLKESFDVDEVPFRKNSAFHKNYCGEFSENFNIGKTDFEQLAKDLKNNLTNPNFIYDWKRYISSSYRTERRIASRRELDGFKPAETTTRVQIHRPFKYIEEGEEKVGYFEEARFNKRICTLNPKPHYFINIDTKNLEASFKIFLFYKNDREKGFNLNNYDTDSDGTFEGIPSKYIAIRLTTKKAADFLAFWELIKGEPFTKSTLKSEFKELYSKNTTDEQLNFLYSIAPVSLIKEKTKVQLWDDATRLLKYDTDRYFTDNSSNQIKVLESIADKENGMQFLYTQFEDNPKIIKDIYTSLDGVGTSQYTLGFAAPNKTIFASLLRALCNYKGQGFHRYKKFITFRNTKGYQVNSPTDLTSKDTSNVIYDIYDTLYDTNDETNYVNEERIALVQEKEEYVENTGTFEPLPKGYVHYLHPLDFVNFVIEDVDGKEITFQVPAIFLKDQAFQRNLKDLIKVIRVGLDILVAVVSAYTLGQGTTPLLTAISIIDLGLATTDIGIQVFAEEIRKIEGPDGEPWGEDFLDTWEHIYLVGGFATGIPLFVPLIGNMLISGGKLLLRITGKARDQLIKMLKYGIERLKNFPKFIGGKFTIITDLSKKFGNSTFTYQLKELYNQGAILTKGVIQGETVSKYYLLFKEEIISFGNIKEIISDTAAIFRLKGAKLLDKLQEFVFLLRRETTLLNTGAKIGEEVSEETIRLGTIKMKLHPSFKEKIDFLKEKGINVTYHNNIEDIWYQVRKFLNKDYSFNRIEKEMRVHPEMRFLDFEHEIDHVLQFEINLKNNVTYVAREFDGNVFRLPNNKAAKYGKLNNYQMTFIEIENRIKEINRLKNNKATGEIIQEHTRGLIEEISLFYKDINSKNKNSVSRWISENFPNFDQSILKK